MIVRVILFLSKSEFRYFRWAFNAVFISYRTPLKKHFCIWRAPFPSFACLRCTVSRCLRFAFPCGRRFLGVPKRETRSQTCTGQGSHGTELPRFLSDVFYKTFSSFERMLAHVTVFEENCTISTRFVTLPEQS